MTIFVDVLKKLIRESLTTVSGDLYTKINTRGYNHDLSREQQAEILKLEESIITFVSTNNDELDSKSIAKLITDACNEVKKIREKFGQSKDSGSTVPHLNSLTLRVPEFYEKLGKFKFNLLNKENKKTPDDIVYFYACCYLGEDIFRPKQTTKIETRIQKENKLAERLKILSELIRPTYTLAERIERTLPVLEDLESDNKGVAKGSAPSLPSISVFGIFQLGSPAEWFAPSTGRLGEWIDVARTEIEKLTPENSDCPIAKPKAKPKDDYEEDEDEHAEHGVGYPAL